MSRVPSWIPFHLALSLLLALLGCATPHRTAPAAETPHRTAPAAETPRRAATAAELGIPEEIPRLAVFLCKHEQFPEPLLFPPTDEQFPELLLSRLPRGTQAAEYIRREDLDFLRSKPAPARTDGLDTPGRYAELARYVECEVTAAASQSDSFKVVIQQTRPFWDRYDRAGLPPEVLSDTASPQRIQAVLEEWHERNPPTVTSFYVLRFSRTDMGWRADYQLPEDERRLAALVANEQSAGSHSEPLPALVWTRRLPFGAGMTRPEKISGPRIRYTQEAIDHGVEGLMIVKCTLTREGEVRRCRSVKPLPFMEAAVVEAVGLSLYKPVTFKGTPVKVEYTFNIKLTLPKSGNAD